MKNESKIRSLIIDDDPFIQDLLQDKLQLYLPEVEVVGTANSGAEGIHRITELQPHLIFLDVEMADMTGFEMLGQLSDIQFATIFITAYSHYAIQAIRFNALDYLVKPIDLGELKASLQRYRDRRGTKASAQRVQQALENLKTPDLGKQKLILQTQEGTLYLPLRDIVRIEGERNYSFVYLTKQKKKLSSKTVGQLEELLQGKGFFRIHKSHLVNRLHITEPPGQLLVRMSDGAELPIARRRRDDFLEWWG